MGFNFDYKEPKIIAEIGCNHMGEMAIAKELIDLAKTAGVKYVKFQKRKNKELLTEEQFNTPHPVLENSYGDTYGAHREYLEFSVDQNKELKDVLINTNNAKLLIYKKGTEPEIANKLMIIRNKIQRETK